MRPALVRGPADDSSFQDLLRDNIQLMQEVILQKNHRCAPGSTSTFIQDAITTECIFDQV